MSKKKQLGMGLTSLFGGEVNSFFGDKTDDLIMIDINEITVNPDQPRKLFDMEKLNDLTESVKSKGIINPIIARRANDGKYQIIAGERRYRAALNAGLKQIPIIVRKSDDKNGLELALIENLQRHDLNHVEEAVAYQALISRYKHTQEQLAKILGKSRTHITNLLRILTLPEDVLEHIKSGVLTLGHAKVMVGHANVSEIAKRVVGEQLNVRQTEKLLANIKNAKSKKKSNLGILRSEDLESLENIMSEKLNLNIKICARANHSGMVQLKFKDFQELDQILQFLNNN